MADIGICVGIKNRTDRLLQCLIKSMCLCTDKDQLTLSIYDCGSEDDVKSQIEKVWPGKLIFTSRQEKFTRSHSINAAVMQCPTPQVFLCDVDMTLPVDFVSQFLANVGPGKVWFPICFTLRKGKPKEVTVINGWWRDTGFGMAGLLRSDFLTVGGLDLKFIRWGGEDSDIHDRCKNAGFTVVRENCTGMFHNWHRRQDWE